MKRLEIYKNLLNKNDYDEMDVFEDIFIKTLSKGINNWEYYNTWNYIKEMNDVWNKTIKLFNNLNNTSSEEDFYIKYQDILEKDYWNVIITTLFLIGIRVKASKYEIQVYDDTEKANLFTLRKKDQSKAEIIKWIFFAKQINLYELLSNVTDFTSYLKGIETGMFSNKRKNISGTRMEKFSFEIIENIIKDNNLKYKVSLSHNKYVDIYPDNMILKNSLPGAKMDILLTRLDNPLNKIIVETNCFSAGGSKIDKTVSEFKENANVLKKAKVPFIWITDGQGWTTTKKDIRDAWSKVDYIFNIKMLNEGAFINCLKQIEKDYFSI